MSPWILRSFDSKIVTNFDRINGNSYPMVTVSISLKVLLMKLTLAESIITNAGEIPTVRTQ